RELMDGWTNRNEKEDNKYCNMHKRKEIVEAQQAKVEVKYDPIPTFVHEDEGKVDEATSTMT
ncbi:hypothetical protein U9M48_001902, partial [Paspalum notatum var. saurae]